MTPCRIAIACMEPQPELDSYWALACVCGYQDAFNMPIEALDGAYQHYTNAHDYQHSKLFIDLGPERDSDASG